MSETKCDKRDFYAELRAITGWSVMHVARSVLPSDDGRAAPTNGGVAIINTAPEELAMALITSDASGLLAVEVRPTDGSWKPVAVVTLYVPHAASVFAHTAVPLYEAAAEAVGGAQVVYGKDGVFVSGDFNARLGHGPIRGAGMRGAMHHSTDATSTAGPDHPFVKFMAKGQLRPTAGRSAAAPAESTSRAIDGGPGRAVVDYWCAHRDFGGVATVPPLPWSDFPTSCTHRPLAVTVAVTAVARPAAGAPPPARGEPPRWRRTAYKDHEPWNVVADHFLGDMEGRAPSGDAWEDLDAMIKAALDAAMPGPAPRGPGPPYRPPPPEGARGGGAAAAAAAVRRARAARGARALALPPPLLALLARGHAARKAARAGGDAEKEAARALLRQATHALRAHHRGVRDEYVAELHRLRVQDPTLFFREVAKLGPAQANLIVLDAKDARVIPDAPGHPPAAARLKAAFAKTHSDAGPAPPAAAPGEAFWKQFIPAAPPGSGAPLERPFTVGEVLAVLYPPEFTAGSLPCPATGTVDHACKLCGDYNTRLHAWQQGGYGNLEHEAPRHSPTGNTAAASKPGDYGVRELRFARPSDPTMLQAFRLAVSERIAAALNPCLAAGKVPAARLTFTVSSILKPARPGAPPPDAADPASRRFIVLGPTLLKIMELLFAARFTHFGLRHGLLDAAFQGAFLPLADTGAHLFALLELLRGRARRGRTTYVLFCDVADAYGSVHIDALCRVLETAGFPPRLVGLVRAWGNDRTAQLRVNGATSEPIPVRRGLAAGACHSPALWNFFIASLARYLASFGAGVQVEEGGAAFSVFIFADDVGAPADSFEALQQLVLRVEAWCTAWGLNLKVAPTKTAFLVAHSPAARARGEHLLAQPPLLLASGTPVPHVHKYTYLGYPLEDTLGRAGLVDTLAARLGHLLAQHFEYNGVISRASAVTTRQVYKTLCVGSVGYLLSLCPLTQAALATLDKVLERAARRFLALPAGTPSLGLTARAGLPSALFLCAAARAGKYLALIEHPAYRASPAAQMAHATRFATPTAATVKGIPPAWMAETAHFFNGWVRDGAVPWPRAESRATGSRAAFAYARRVCHAADRRDAPADAPPGMARASRLPTDPKPKHAAAAAALGYSFPAALLGGLRATALSYGGVGGVAPLALTTVGVPFPGTAGMAAAQYGAGALAGAPLGPAAWALPTGASHEAYGAAARGRPCPLCPPGPGGAAAPTATPFHVLCECRHAPLVALRGAVEGEMGAFLRSLVGTVEAAARRQPGHAAVTAAAAQARAALAAGAGAPHGPFLFFRTVLALPWHAAAIDEPGAARAAALGRLFDAAVIPNAALHKIFDSWVPWGARRLGRLTGLWSAAVDALAAAPAAPAAAAAAAAGAQ